MTNTKNIDKYNEIKHKYINSIPVDVIGLANELGIEVYQTKLDDDKLSGYIAQDAQGYFICVNKNHAATRQQFTIAHEIGHFAIHQDLLENNEIAPTRYKNGVPLLQRSQDYNSEQYRRLEREANRFAAELLMPEKQFIDALNEYDNLDEIARAFKVSIGAASIRANNLGVEIF